MAENLWCLLIPLLVGGICTLLGFLWGKQNQPAPRKGSIDSEKYDRLKEENFHLRQDLDIAQLHLKEMQEQLFSRSNGSPAAVDNGRGSRASKRESMKTGTNPGPVKVVASEDFDQDRASREYGKRVKQNDFKIVEGIGPKIEVLLKEAGLLTWKELSETSPERLKEILQEGGDRFRMHDPASWPLQASLADRSLWKDLAAWQESHKAGKL